MRTLRWIGAGLLGVVLATSTASAATSDAWITTKAKMSLLTTAGVSGTSINVDTVDGRVTLHGKVQSADEKAKAETVARGIEGVRDVRNLLQVVPSSQQNAVKAKDEDVESEVKRALEAREDLRRAGIGVEVKNGVARLSGTVPSQEQRITAAVAARGANGVRSVQDDLRVGTSVD